MRLIRWNLCVTAMMRKCIQWNFNWREMYFTSDKPCSDLLIFIPGMSTTTAILFKCIGTQNALRAARRSAVQLINQFQMILI
jgi:hypothetical protein